LLDSLLQEILIKLELKQNSKFKHQNSIFNDIT